MVADGLERPGGAALSPRIPIVVFGDDWGRHVSSMQHLFRHVARDYQIIWVNAIGHRVPGVRRQDLRRVLDKLRSLAQLRRMAPAGEIRQGALPRRIIHPRVLPWHHWRLVRGFNRRSLVRAIRRTLRDIGADEPPLLVTGSPPSVSVLGELKEVAAVYYCMDDFLHLPNVSPEMLRPLETELLQRVDALVATARALLTSKRPRTGRVYYLPQGVNYDHFAQPRPAPADVVGLPKPVIGFAGGLTTPVDLALLKHLAEANPGASLVLVGPVYMDLSSIRAPNVHVLGARPYRELPAYVQTFDVGIIPYMLNPHTLAVDPLKLLEYLAAGVPVVTTDLPEVRKYRHAVDVAVDHDAFVSAVAAALAGGSGSREARQRVAREHDWSRRADELVRILGEVVSATR